KLIMLPSETMIWQPEFTDKTLSRKPGAVHHDLAASISVHSLACFRSLIGIQPVTPGINSFHRSLHCRV
ncbi:hypothetical protein SNB89_12750, partial [Escherichia coli]|nr:hypothetical protein [Escherichia coli]